MADMIVYQIKSKTSIVVKQISVYTANQQHALKYFDGNLILMFLDGIKKPISSPAQTFMIFVYSKK